MTDPKSELRGKNSVIESKIVSISFTRSPWSYQDCIGFSYSADLTQMVCQPHLNRRYVALATLQIFDEMASIGQRHLSCGWIDEGRSLSYSLTKIMPGSPSFVWVSGAQEIFQPTAKKITVQLHAFLSK